MMAMTRMVDSEEEGTVPLLISTLIPRVYEVPVLVLAAAHVHVHVRVVEELDVAKKTSMAPT